MTKHCGSLLGLACAVLFLSPSTHANMIRNPSFEEPAPTSSRHALHWRMHEPDTHGDAYGSASREDWRSHDGMNIMTVRGTWANAGDHGGVWQEAAAEPGKTYRASAWFWADPDWDPEVQELKMEFFDADYSELLKTKSVALRKIPPEWERREISAKAPDRTAWVRLVINVEGTGDNGALQIDSIYMSPRDTFEEPTPEPVDVIIDLLDDPKDEPEIEAQAD